MLCSLYVCVYVALVSSVSVSYVAFVLHTHWCSSVFCLWRSLLRRSMRGCELLLMFELQATDTFSKAPNVSDSNTTFCPACGNTTVNTATVLSEPAIVIPANEILLLILLQYTIRTF